MQYWKFFSRCSSSSRAYAVNPIYECFPVLDNLRYNNLCFVPVCLFIIVEKPSDINLYVDNIENAETEKEVKKDIVIPLKTVLRFPEVYYIGFTFGFMLMSSSSVLSQLKTSFYRCWSGIFYSHAFDVFDGIFLCHCKISLGLAL